MPVHNRPQAKSALLGGVVAGAVAGLVILPYAGLVALLRGQDLLLGLKLPSAWLLGDRALEPGFDFAALYFGLGTHFAVSIAWGAAFALLAYGLGRVATLVLALIWGVLVWLVMFHLVLPVAGLADAARSTPLHLALIEHLLFGAALGLAFLPFQKEMPRDLSRSDLARQA